MERSTRNPPEEVALRLFILCSRVYYRDCDSKEFRVMRTTCLEAGIDPFLGQVVILSILEESRMNVEHLFGKPLLYEISMKWFKKEFVRHPFLIQLKQAITSQTKTKKGYSIRSVIQEILNTDIVDVEYLFRRTRKSIRRKHKRSKRRSEV